MTERLSQDIGLRHPRDGEGGLHARGDPPLFDRVLHREGIDDGRQHSHVIGGGAVHFGSLAAPPEVASAQDDADFDAHLLDLDDLIDDFRDDGLIQPEPAFSRERLAGELDNDPLVLCFRHKFSV
jgi:hypothetical protein